MGSTGGSNYSSINNAGTPAAATPTSSGGAQYLNYGLGAISLVGGLVQAQATQSRAEYQKRIDDQNASMALFQADDALKRGDREANIHNQRVASMVGDQRANMGAQGIAVDSGQAEQIQEQTYKMGYDDALTIKNNAFREAWGLQNQAIDFRSRGQFAQIAGQGNATQTLLSAGMTAGDYFSKGLKIGSSSTKQTPIDPYESRDPTEVDYQSSGSGRSSNPWADLVSSKNERTG